MYKKLKKESYKNRLGNATWQFLHTLAEGYPETPSKSYQLYTSNLLDTLSYIYPCYTCSAHMRKMFKEHPYRLETRSDFRKYLCKYRRRCINYII